MKTLTQDFDDWNGIKKTTNKNKRKLGIKPREIFWAKIGLNIGSEKYGKDKHFARPVIIIRRLTSDLFIGVPLTSTIKNNDYFHSFKYDNKQNGCVYNSAMILQLKVYSIKRLMNKVGIVNKSDFNFIVEKCQKIVSPT
ncbi:type II toxin-antitoxin system PemK/MazF family toxin [Arcobacter sp. YIC-310]|uniref:type II toxin-antitoxin system PemK/MazF family toxin n=1 Tax=Arcobacter sp. YIC-310 TaxID=3376632 RepID=UPI003C19DEFE